MPQQYRTSLAEIVTSGTRQRAVTALIRLRVYLAPVLGTVAVTFAIIEPTPWRRWMLGVAICVLFSITIVEAIRYRRQGFTRATLPLNLLVMMSILVVIATTTGGLFSPFCPGFMVGSAVVGFVIGRRYLIPLVGLVVLPALWTFAIVHESGHPVHSLIPVVYGSTGSLEHGPVPWFVAGVYSVMVLSVSRISLALRGSVDDMFTQAIDERDRLLSVHADQNRALTTLTAEIAHELKNPLTSVKGLASLLAKDVEGKPAERLAVLRQEVDRMQGVFEEFLNFSRPLVPLSIEEIDLSQVARDVVRLHEGNASVRSVRLSVDAADDLSLRADERKVRQIVMNLVQNALEASPRGGEVVVRVARANGGAQLSVLDRGEGIDPDVEGRLFDAGVTTKAQGSGIGLAVARGLARQHGGDLTIGAREGGGCAASLSLPNKARAEERT